jgi:hypothetical protein
VVGAHEGDVAAPGAVGLVGVEQAPDQVWRRGGALVGRGQRPPAMRSVPVQPGVAHEAFHALVVDLVAA